MPLPLSLKSDQGDGMYVAGCEIPWVVYCTLLYDPTLLSALLRNGECLLQAPKVSESCSLTLLLYIFRLRHHLRDKAGTPQRVELLLQLRRDSGFRKGASSDRVYEKGALK